MSTRAPTIVVDARMATDGGIGTYLQQLLPRIARMRPGWRFTALGDANELGSLGWGAGAIPNVTILHATPPIFSMREQVELAARIERNTSLYWAPNYNVALLARRPLVVTVHDVNHMALPALLGGPVRRAYARWLLASAVGRADRVLFDSEFTKNEAERVLDDGAANGTVVHLGVDESWTRARESAPERPLRERYFLYVGNIKRHKNVPFLLRAFGRVVDRIPHRLVLIGRTVGLRADPDVAEALEPLRGRAVLLGEVPGETVKQFVAHAEALVTASLYEGFGLPALEAMAAGCPCILSTAGSLPEVAGDAALYADPRDESSFANRMLELAESASLREDLIRRGRRRAAEFTWGRSATLTCDVLEQALNGRSS